MNSTKNLPPFPKSWFLIGKSVEFSSKPRSLQVGGCDIVVFRNSANELSAFERRCPHMNADLADGVVVNQNLQCALHRWEFDREGQCQHIPNLAHDKIPAKAKVTIFPIKEQFGFVFFFNDQKALFELPFFQNENADAFESSSRQLIHTHNEWFVGAANAFDIAHFETVHLRHLLSEPVISKPAEHAYRIELNYEIRGNSFSDRLMKIFYGKEAKLDFTVFAGNFILAVTSVKGLKNYMMIVNEPDGTGKSIAHLMVFSKKTNNPFKKLKREIQAGLSRKFFQDEADASIGVFIDTLTLSPNDQIIKDYLLWLMSIY